MVVKIGFVGCGQLAQRHVDRLVQIEKAKIVALSDTIVARAENLARKTNARAYSNPEEMLRKEDLDAVYVITPPFVRDILMEIADQGLHFFVEKPVALSVDLAKKIERRIVKSGVLTSIGYQLRYFPTTDLVKNTLERKGPVGLIEGYDHFPLRMVADHRGGDVFTVPQGHWTLSKEKSGEQIVESTTHVFDLARYLVGEVSKVYGDSNRLLLNDIDGFDKADVSVVNLKFKNGAVGVITSTLATRKTDLSTVLKIVAKNTVVEHLCYNGIVRFYEDTEIKEIRPTVDPFLEEDKTFVEAVSSGDGSAIKSTYSDGVRTLMVTTAAVESSLNNNPIILE